MRKTFTVAILIALVSLPACGRNFATANGQPQPSVDTPYTGSLNDPD